jgi:acyl dehydratase
MHNANPLHYDDAFAARSIFGRLVAPQSFAIACDQEHGVIPAHAGRIPGSHILWGGCEWFFYGARIYPGDRIECERVPHDYRISNTGFAGPTVFQRGDTLYINQRGETVCRCRTTAVRYLIENARRLKNERAAATGSDEPEWTAEQLEQVHEERFAYLRSFRERPPRQPGELRVGEKLTRGVLGPHSIASFASEWRAYLWSRGWGGNRTDGKQSDDEAGFEFGSGARYRRRGVLDPEQLDISYYGQARGHLDPNYARRIGMPRPYGYGASMASWVLDYASNWAGPYGLITHSKYEARNPALSGEVTYLDGTVTAVQAGDDDTSAVASIAVEMSSHPGGRLLGRATVDVRIDPSRKPDAILEAP